MGPPRPRYQPRRIVKVLLKNWDLKSVQLKQSGKGWLGVDYTFFFKNFLSRRPPKHPDAAVGYLRRKLRAVNIGGRTVEVVYDPMYDGGDDKILWRAIPMARRGASARGES